MSDIIDRISELIGIKAFRGDDESLKVVTIPFGIPNLDNMLGGGVPRGRIMHMSGDFGTGKTVLCQRLMKSVQKDEGSVVYFNVENKYDPSWFCFLEGTNIITKTDDKFHSINTKHIEDIKIGDEVLSYNGTLKEFKKVTKTFCRDADEFVVIKFSNGNQLVCTPEHPIAVNRNGNIKWIKANELIYHEECIQYKYHGLSLRLYNLSKKDIPVDEFYSGDSLSNIKFGLETGRCGGYTDITKRKVSESKKKIWNDVRSVYRSKEYIKSLSDAKVGRSLIDIYGGEDNLNKALEKRKVTMFSRYGGYPKPMLGKKHSDETKGKIGVRSAIALNAKASYSELKMIDILDDVCPDKFEFNNKGQVQRRLDIKFPCVPDFVWVNGKKIIRVNGCHVHCCPKCDIKFDIRGRSALVIRERDEKQLKSLENMGWDVLDIWDHCSENDKKKKIADFVYNKDVEIVKVVGLENVPHRGLFKVYNLEVEDNNNYFAEGILVHNCTTGIDVSKIVVVQGNIAESVMDGMIACVQDNIDLIVVDSVAALLPITEDEDPVSKQHIGLQPRTISQGLRKVIKHLAVSKSAIVFTNQLRSNIGGYGGDTNPGGRAPKFYATICLVVRRGEWKMDGKKRIGFDMVVSSIKNQIAPPWREVVVPFSFDGSFDIVSCLMMMASDVGIIKKSGAWYNFGSVRAQGWDGLKNKLLENKDLLRDLSDQVYQSDVEAAISAEAEDMEVKPED